MQHQDHLDFQRSSLRSHIVTISLPVITPVADAPTDDASLQIYQPTPI